MEELELICFQMISAAGNAKSLYVEAVQEAKQKNYTKAHELIEEGEKSFVEGHHFHGELIGKECNGEKTEMTLLLTHVEDQMMAAEIIKLMAEEIIELYEKISD